MKRRTKKTQPRVNQNVIQFVVSADEKTRLEQLAKADDRTVSNFVRRRLMWALRNYKLGAEEAEKETA